MEVRTCGTLDDTCYTVSMTVSGEIESRFDFIDICITFKILIVLELSLRFNNEFIMHD